MKLKTQKMKQIILTLTLLTMVLGMEGRTVRDFFASEPGELLTLVPKTVRLDMLDYYDSGTIVQANNNMGSGTQLDTVTDNFLRLRTSDVKTLEMRLMRWKNDTIIAVVETVETPVKDSHITFYNKHWVRLKEIKEADVTDEIKALFTKERHSCIILTIKLRRCAMQKILIADDEPNIVTLISRYAQREGYDVTAVQGRTSIS